MNQFFNQRSQIARTTDKIRLQFDSYPNVQLRGAIWTCSDVLKYSLTAIGFTFSSKSEMLPSFKTDVLKIYQSSVKLFSLQPPDGKLKKTANASKQELCCN